MCVCIKYAKILGSMAWGYYNLTWGHCFKGVGSCLKGVGHLFWECMTFGFREQDICPNGVRHLPEHLSTQGRSNPMGGLHCFSCQNKIWTVSFGVSDALKIVKTD